ncbi:MAG: dienelactone hydrolase family protein [Planctomycetaceae bacterium]
MGASPPPEGVLATIAAAEETRRKGVDWLAKRQSIPEMLPPEAPKLSPLLVTVDGEPIVDREGWQRRRKELRDEWLKLLGPLATQPRKLPKLRVLEEDIIDNVIRQRVEYECEPGLTTEGYLLTPQKLTGKVPGIVVFHSTVDHSIRQPAGLEGVPEKWLGLRFAKEGFVTFSPRNFLWPTNEKIAAKQETERFQARHPTSVGMAKMLYDAQLAVDILTARPEVDPDRLGSIGHSLGAKEVLYLAAFDDRVKVTVSSEGGIGTKFSNWDAPWYLGPMINDPTWTREHHELLALIAPRPFLLIGGNSADGDQSWPFIKAALPLYRLLSETPPALAFLNHNQSHTLPPTAEKHLGEWLHGFL